MNILRYLLGLGFALTIGLGLSGCDKEQPPASAPEMAPATDSGAPAASAVVATVDDGVVTTKVKAALLADPDIKSFDIQAETTNGDVRLSGTVDNQTQIDRAVEVVRRVEGVKNVTNQLAIKQ